MLLETLKSTLWSLNISELLSAMRWRTGKRSFTNLRYGLVFVHHFFPLPHSIIRITRQTLAVCRRNLWIMKRREPWLQQAIGVRSPRFCVLLCSKCSRLKVQPQEASFLLKDLRVLKCLINLAAPQPGR